MSERHAYRAELANQVVVRLQQLSESDWSAALAVLTERRVFFNIAYQLAAHAIDIMVEEEGEESRTPLTARLNDIDGLFCSPVAGMKSVEHCLMARGAVLAVYLRDTRGFNVGAFKELFAPVEGMLPFDEIAAIARGATGLDADDFKTGAIKKPRSTEVAEPQRRRA